MNLLTFFDERAAANARPAGLAARKRSNSWRRPWDEPLLSELSQAMADASICGLGQAAPNPIRSVLNHFRGDVL